MEEKRVSRREMIRNIGIAGAVAWAAPVLSSLPASASVDVCTRKRSKRLCRGIDGNCNNGFTQCGICNGDVGDGSYCFEEIGTLRNFCGTDSFCSGLTTCFSSAGCAANEVCITNNGCTGCGSSSGVCVRRCCRGVAGPGRSAKVRRLGKTVTGR
jgi:hypothetical protein